MFEKLNKDQYKSIIPLLTNSHLSLNILPVIHQTFDGEVWVDDEFDVRIAYIFDTRHGHFLVGDIEYNGSVSIEFIKNLFSTRFIGSGNFYSLLYAKDWLNLSDLENICQVTNSTKYTRQLYKYTDSTIANWRSLIPDGFKIKPVTKNILGSKLKNFSGLFDELKYMWGNIDNFFMFGFGTCAIFDDSLAGWCLGEYFVNTTREKFFGIGIETDPQFQKKGIATVMASMMIEMGLKKGYTIYWDCFKDNIASSKTALKLGFNLDMEYEILEGRF